MLSTSLILVKRFCFTDGVSHPVIKKYESLDTELYNSFSALLIQIWYIDKIMEWYIALPLRYSCPFFLSTECVYSFSFIL